MQNSWFLPPFWLHGMSDAIDLLDQEDQLNYLIELLRIIYKFILIQVIFLLIATSSCLMWKAFLTK